MIPSSECPQALDVWSVGAIFAELLGRKPLFPGKDYVHQLNLIFEVVGSPEEADIASIESAMARRYVLSLPQRKGVPLERLFPSASPAALDLLRGLLAVRRRQQRRDWLMPNVVSRAPSVSNLLSLVAVFLLTTRTILHAGLDLPPCTYMDHQRCHRHRFGRWRCVSAVSAGFQDVFKSLSQNPRVFRRVGKIRVCLRRFGSVFVFMYIHVYTCIFMYVGSRKNKREIQVRMVVLKLLCDGSPPAFYPKH